MRIEGMQRLTREGDTEEARPAVDPTQQYADIEAALDEMNTEYDRRDIVQEIFDQAKWEMDEMDAEDALARAEGRPGRHDDTEEVVVMQPLPPGQVDMTMFHAMLAGVASGEIEPLQL